MTLSSRSYQALAVAFALLACSNHAAALPQPKESSTTHATTLTQAKASSVAPIAESKASSPTHTTTLSGSKASATTHASTHSQTKASTTSQLVSPSMISALIPSGYSIPAPVLDKAAQDASLLAAGFSEAGGLGALTGSTLGSAQQTAKNIANSTAQQLAVAAWYNRPTCYWVGGDLAPAVSWFILIPEWQTPYNHDTANNDIRGSLSGNSACNSYTTYTGAATGFANWGAENTTTGAAFLTDDFCTAWQMTNVIKATTGNAKDIACVEFKSPDGPLGDPGSLAFDSFGNDGSDDPGAEKKRSALSLSSNPINDLISKAGSIVAPQHKTQADVKDLIPSSLYKPNMTDAEVIKALSGPA